MKTERKCIFLLIFSTFALDCIGQFPRINSEKINAIDTFLENQLTKGFSGSVLISENAELKYHASFGYADRETQRPIDTLTLFEIASVTKLFTVVAILQLAEKGELSLEDKLSTHLGPFVPPKDQATIRHLLLHTAGLVPRGHALDYSHREGFIESVKQCPPESIPGEVYRYTNAGYTVLAAIIENITGLSYGQYLSENIFEPLGLTHTYYGLLPTIKNYAEGYTGPTSDSLQLYPYREAEWGDRGPTGIFTNALDLHSFLEGLQNEKLLSKAYVTKMFEEQYPAEALGFHVLEKPGIGKVLARGGGLPHFESQVAWYVDDKIKLIILINNRLRLRQPIWDGIENIIYNN